MKTLLLFAVLIALFTISTAAQTTEPVLVKLPKAVNPPDGYPGGGRVQLRIAVNEQGEVTEAKFVRGPGAVCGWVSQPDVTRTREAAVAIAREAKFTPATSGGVPVATSTNLLVKFPSPDESETKYSPGDLTKSTTGSLSGDARTIFGGVLNGKAVSLPKPDYSAARAAGASGAVQVQVVIDEDGNVFQADPAGGHVELRYASFIAACSAKFSPTLLNGIPVKVSGIITYNFVP